MYVYNKNEVKREWYLLANLIRTQFPRAAIMWPYSFPLAVGKEAPENTKIGLPVFYGMQYSFTINIYDLHATFVSHQNRVYSSRHEINRLLFSERKKL